MAGKTLIFDNESLTKDLFSQDTKTRQVEEAFLPRMVRFMKSCTVEQMQVLANSGQFNQVFPDIDDGYTPAKAQVFSELKPFDYARWKREQENFSDRHSH